MSIRFSIVLSEGELLVCHERWHAMKGLLDVGYQLTSAERNDDQARADLAETIASVPQHIGVFSNMALCRRTIIKIYIFDRSLPDSTVPDTEAKAVTHGY